MNIDTRLPLAVNERPIDTATGVQQMGQQQNQNAMAAEQTLKAHYEALDAREKSRLSSTIVGAVQLKSFLDNDDLDGAHDFLVKRKSALQQRMGSGENIDTQETDAALEMLRNGRVDELKNGVSGLMAAGQVYGVLSNKDMPSNIQEWQAYNKLSPQDQERYLTMKRANPVVNIGGSHIIPSQSNPAGAPQTVIPNTLPPQDQPDNARNKAAAMAEGTTIGEAGKTLNKTTNLVSVLDALAGANADAPSGVLSDITSSLSNKAGFTTESNKAQGTWQVKRAAAENAIRETFRVAGSGADTERDALPFIQMLPEAGDAEGVKASKTAAALEAIKLKASMLAKQRGVPDPFANSALIMIFNPQTGEEAEIEAADLPAAQAEGFQRR